MTRVVKALLPHQIFVPPELALPNECLSLTNEATVRMLSDLQINNSVAFNSTDVGNKKKSKIKIFVQAHCGRKKNTRRELTVTLSHLMAIRAAIYDDGFSHSGRKKGSGSSPYALILEDDLQIAFDVDFPALIQSSPNATGFGILQLVTSNEFSVVNLRKVYEQHKTLWVKRKDKDDYWCAGAYIINKPILKPYIDAIFVDMNELLDKKVRSTRYLRNDPNIENISFSSSKVTDRKFHRSLLSNFSNGLSLSGPRVVKIIAGYQSPCWPKFCCKGPGLASGPGSACVHAARYLIFMVILDNFASIALLFFTF